MFIYLQMIETPEDRSKFEDLYLRYKNIMFFTANKILHNYHDAENAVHAAFVKIAENIEKIEAPDSPKTRGYVVTIVEHAAIDLYRKHKRTTTANLEEWKNLGLTVEYDGHNSLAACILKLPANYRECILLRYYHGYDTHEIARALGISESAAFKLNQRAKKKLLELCQEEGLL